MGQLTRLPRLATAWSPHPGASPFLLPILRGTWSTFPPECAPLTGLQSVCWSSLRNGSPPCTPRLVSVGPTWPSADLPPSSAPRSTLSWSMTSMLDLVSSLSWLVWLSRLAQTGLPLLTRLLMKMKLLWRASDRARLILARLLLPMRNQSRPTPQPGRTSLLPRRRLSVSSWRESTGPGSSLPTLVSYCMYGIIFASSTEHSLIHVVLDIQGSLGRWLRSRHLLSLTLFRVGLRPGQELLLCRNHVFGFATPGLDARTLHGATKGKRESPGSDAIDLLMAFKKDTRVFLADTATQKGDTGHGGGNAPLKGSHGGLGDFFGGGFVLAVHTAHGHTGLE